MSKAGEGRSGWRTSAFLSATPTARADGALVVFADGWNWHAPTLTVLPITRTSHDLPTRIELEATTQSALDEISYACCEEIRAISERRLVRSLGRVDSLVMLSVSRSLRLFLDD